MKLSTVAAALSLVASAVHAATPKAVNQQWVGVDGKKKNIVLVLTDDQDAETIQERFLPKIHKHLVDEGILFDNFFAPVSVCCPSRVSLLRGQLAHNHNITFVSQPWGGWARFNELGYVGHHLPDFLQQAGYKTYLVGKYQNDHTVDNCESLPLSGWTSSDALVDPNTYDYWNPAFSLNNGPAVVHPGEYSTDLVAQKALAYLDTALAEEDPFFLYIAPVACHSWISAINIEFPLPPDGKFKLISDIPAAHPRHQRLFTDVHLDRHEGFNPDFPTGVAWVKTLPKLNKTVEAYLDEFYRGRLRALQPVDELVEDVVEKLRAAGKLDDTYIIYTADNGYALGTHRRQPGKTLGFEEDLHVPLIVRGPGIKKGFRDTLSSYGMADLGATILAIAGANADYTTDGNVIQPVLDAEKAHGQRHSLSEYWTLAGSEGFYGGQVYTESTYRTLRVHDETPAGNYSYSYSVWCTGERELYDLDEDPRQVRNLVTNLNAHGEFAPFDAKDKKTGKHILSKRLQQVLTRIDTLLLALKNCTGDECRQPWSTIFSNPGVTGGQLSSFSEALESKFDNYFATRPRVAFSGCHLGYQSRLEHPIWRAEWAYGHGSSNPLLLQL